MSTSAKESLSLVKKAGLFTKGLVYILMGGLTSLAAVGMGGKTSGKSGVSQFLMEQPFGMILLGTVSLGLISYAIWRVYEAYVDPGEKKSRKRIPTRLRYLYSAVFYAFVAYSFMKPIFSGSSGGSDKKQQILAQCLEHKWGIYLILAIALIVLGQSVFQFTKGISGSFMKKLDDNPDAKKEYTLIKRAGLVGYVARGVVFLVIAYLLVRVVIDHNANRYDGTKGVFEYISSLTLGEPLLIITALGLLFYGLFNVMVARHTDLTNIS